MEKHFNRYIKIHPVRFGVGFLLLPAVFTSLLIWPFQIFNDDFARFQYSVPYLVLIVVMIMYFMLVRVMKNLVGPRLSREMQALWLNQGLSKKSMLSLTMRYVTQIESTVAISIAGIVWFVFPKSFNQITISSVIVSLMLLVVVRGFFRGQIQIRLFSDKHAISVIPLYFILIAATNVLRVENATIRNSVIAMIGVASVMYAIYIVNNIESLQKTKTNYLNRDQH